MENKDMEAVSYLRNVLLTLRADTNCLDQEDIRVLRELEATLTRLLGKHLVAIAMNE